ncbi:MAG: glycoside hydrolase family 3 N-terminal domain-containing protein [Chloroflexota bacterium]
MTYDRRISRRALLGAMAAGSVAAGLAACGGVSPSTGPAPGGQSATPSTVSSSTPASAPPSRTPPAATPSADPAKLRAKIARMLLFGFRGLTIGPNDPITRAITGGLGGVILFDRDQMTGGKRNIASPAQLAELTTALRAAASSPLLIALDQEGGRVSRLNPAMGFPATKTEAAIGATSDPAIAHAAGLAMGRTMAKAGVNFDLAPVVDVNVDPRNPAIGALDRSFSADPSIVAALAEAEIRGLHEAGIRSAIKHFPGLGSAAANTDFAVVDVTKTWTEMELEPFQTLIGLDLPDAIMSAHILDRRRDPDAPASLSPATVDVLLRGRLGWSGAVMTDDLGAVAITSRFSQAEAIAKAIEAGNDLLTFANQATYVPDLAEHVIDTIVGFVASGRVSESRIDQSIARLDILAAGPRG